MKPPCRPRSVKAGRFVCHICSEVIVDGYPVLELMCTWCGDIVEPSELWKGLKMQVPKSIFVETEQQAKDMAEIMNRPVMVELKGRFFRVSPSGKMDDLTDKIATVRKLLAADPRQSDFVKGVK